MNVFIIVVAHKPRPWVKNIWFAILTEYIPVVLMNYDFQGYISGVRTRKICEDLVG
jgi:hypothetical protein